MPRYRRPRIRVSANGLHLVGPYFRIGSRTLGLNFSSHGVTAGGGSGPFTYNSRSFLSKAAKRTGLPHPGCIPGLFTALLILCGTCMLCSISNSLGRNDAPGFTNDQPLPTTVHQVYPSIIVPENSTPTLTSIPAPTLTLTPLQPADLIPPPLPTLIPSQTANSSPRTNTPSVKATPSRTLTPRPAPTSVPPTRPPVPTSLPPTIRPAPTIAAPTASSNGTTRIGAKCKDGTTSTATGSGACSQHGGVSQWLYK